MMPMEKKAIHAVVPLNIMATATARKTIPTGRKAPAPFPFDRLPGSDPDLPSALMLPRLRLRTGPGKRAAQGSRGTSPEVRRSVGRPGRVVVNDNAADGRRVSPLLAADFILLVSLEALQPA